MTETERRNADIENRRLSALWYAFGRRDAEGGPNVAWDFAEYAAREALAYYRGEGRTLLASIQSQWAEFTFTLIKES